MAPRFFSESRALVQYFCTVFFVKSSLMASNEWSSQTHGHYPGFALITWWSRMKAFFSAENLNLYFHANSLEKNVIVRADPKHVAVLSCGSNKT